MKMKTTLKNLPGTAKVGLREFITVNAYNLKRSQTNNLALHLKELGKKPN